jgi:tRNA-dihydrouridine synthase
MLRFHGRELGLRMARKHLGWYLDAIPGAAPLRRALMVETDAATVLDLLRSRLADTDARVAA